MSPWCSSLVLILAATTTTAVVLRGEPGERRAPPGEQPPLLEMLKKQAQQVNSAVAGSPSLGMLESSLTGKSSKSWEPLEPLLPGVTPGIQKPKLILAQDIDWPPYAYLGDPPEADYEVAGIGHDIAMGLSSVCDIDVTVVQTGWSDCWTAGHIGTGLIEGHYHGCMTYTHTLGARPRYLEFSDAFLQDNKPAGILTRLDSSGNPVVSPMSNLSGVTIVDVGGWAPTADALAVVQNPCTGASFVDYNMITPPEDGNDAAMKMLLDGSADAMWVYADQAYLYQCSTGVTESWNCTLWEGLGTQFAYIQTGLYGHALNGTTLTISKKGSGLAEIVDPCLKRFMATEAYYNICSKHGLTGSCYANSYFPNSNSSISPWDLPTNLATTTCAEGYCPCSA